MTIEEAYNRVDAIIEKHEVDDVYVTITNSKDYDALRIARKQLEQTRWIPASEKPSEEGDYLVVFRLGGLMYCREICYFDGNTWHKGGYDEVVKWQYLPNIEEGEG